MFNKFLNLNQLLLQETICNVNIKLKLQFKSELMSTGHV